MRKHYKDLDVSKTILITGGAGFIGFHLSKCLLELGCRVIGFDNLNNYYEIKLKKDRLSLLNEFSNYTFEEGDLADKVFLDAVFKKHLPEVVVNLAAQAGVRYSISNPDAYIMSNLVGFNYILECCRHNLVEHFLFASSSSVYGENSKIPFSIEDQTDSPVSLYAATKKSNELMAYAYSKLYEIPSTGLRFFTVYGPYGRPDMAYFKFAQCIMSGNPIQIYNYGDMLRDFTYIDDIVSCVKNMICNAPEPNSLGVRYKIYNIGNNRPEKLGDFIQILERYLGKEAVKEYLPMQKGDVYQTYADVSELVSDFDFKPNTGIEEGLKHFVEWFKETYKF